MSEDKLPLDDPVTPAIARWIVRALLYLFACFAGICSAGWELGRLLFHSGAFVPVLCGIALTVGTYEAIAHFERMGNHHIAKGHRAPEQWDRIMVDVAILLVSAAVFVAYRARGGGLSTTATLILLPGAVALWRMRAASSHSLGWFVLRHLARLIDKHCEENLHTIAVAIKGLYDANWKGVLPRDWDRELLAVACGDTGKGTTLSSGYIYAYYAALDRGDVAGAEGWLDRLDGIGKKLQRNARAILASERAFILARYKRSPGPARGVLRAFRGAAHNPDFFNRAAAASYLAERRPGPFRGSAARALSSKRRKHLDGVTQLHDRLVNEMLAEASRTGEAEAARTVAD